MSGKRVLILAVAVTLWVAAPVLAATAEDASKELVAGQGVTASAKGIKANLETVANQLTAASAETAPVETQGVGSAVQMAQEEVRDPFQSQLKTGVEADEAAPKTEQVIKVSLQGVGFGSTEDAYAVLNGDVYYLEEEKKGIKLVNVRKREADVFVNGAMQTLRLFDEAALKKSTAGRRKTGILGAS